MTAPAPDVTPDVKPASLAGFVAVVAAAAVGVVIAVRYIGDRLPLPPWLVEHITGDDDQDQEDQDA